MFNTQKVIVELAEIERERFLRGLVKRYRPTLAVEGKRLVERRDPVREGAAIIRKI